MSVIIIIIIIIIILVYAAVKRSHVGLRLVAVPPPSTSRRHTKCMWHPAGTQPRMHLDSLIGLTTGVVSRAPSGIGLA
jgi:hypothetical protein